MCCSDGVYRNFSVGMQFEYKGEHKVNLNPVQAYSLVNKSTLGVLIWMTFLSSERLTIEEMPPVLEPQNASAILKKLLSNYDKRLRPGHAGKFRVFLFLLPLLKWDHVHPYLSRKLFPLTAKISTIRYRTDLAKSVLFLPFAKITFFSLRPTFFFFFRTTTWYCDRHWSAVHFKYWGRKHGKPVLASLQFSSLSRRHPTLPV